MSTKGLNLAPVSPSATAPTCTSANRVRLARDTSPKCSSISSSLGLTSTDISSKSCKKMSFVRQNRGTKTQRRVLKLKETFETSRIHTEIPTEFEVKTNGAEDSSCAISLDKKLPIMVPNSQRFSLTIFPGQRITDSDSKLPIVFVGFLQAEKAAQTCTRKFTLFLQGRRGSNFPDVRFLIFMTMLSPLKTAYIFVLNLQGVD